ncbi:MAG: heme exporter protein CcmB [Bacteroidia bacterium]
MLKEVFILLRKEVLLESRQKHAANSLVLYLVSTVFVCKLCFRSVPEPGAWNALFWIIMLFASINAAGKSFVQDSRSRFIYLYSVASPQAIILAKVVYNMFLMILLTSIGFLVYILLLGNNPVQNMPLFAGNALLGSIGFSAILTTMSAIASRTNNSFTLMAVLSFPLILPLLMTLIRVSRNAIEGLDITVSYKYLLVLAGINVICTVLSYLLFPYLWKD